MQERRRRLLGSTLALALLATAVYGADQTILGLSFVTKGSTLPRGRKVLVTAKEGASPNTIVGDPTASGATLVVTAHGGTPSTQTFLLPAPNWKGSATRGFTYKDRRGTAGAVRVVKIALTRRGKFVITALATGKTGTLDIVPPDPGTDACALLGIVGGDSYSVRFGPDSQITNRGAKLFRAKRPATQGSCTTTTTSTTPITSSTTSTTLYGSPSRAFVSGLTSLLD
jgi:hypothetical protein